MPAPPTHTPGLEALGQALHRLAARQAARHGVVAVAQVVGDAHALALRRLGAGGLAQLGHLQGGGALSTGCVTRLHQAQQDGQCGSAREWRALPGCPRPLPPFLPAPTLSAERPMTDTMPEGCASAAACMLSPRSFTSRTPSSKLMAPG